MFQLKKVAIIQSNYIPWKGYFDIINDVDLFIFYDDVQYTKNDWRNRNNIKTENGITWLTIPIGKRHGRFIHEVKIDDKKWAKKHWSTIKQYYSKAPFFLEYKDYFEHVYCEAKWEYLSDLNQYIIKYLAKECLGVNTEFKDSREYNLTGHKFERLMELIKKAKADIYISGPSARSYIEKGRFDEEGIKLVYKDYSNYPEYHQFYPPFTHNVSIIDLLFHTGPDAPDYIWGWREDKNQIEIS